jgi:hypothetical protein
MLFGMDLQKHQTLVTKQIKRVTVNETKQNEILFGSLRKLVGLFL